MEQILTNGARRSGWSDKECQMLWETADEAQLQGLPLKTVFEQVAKKTGRRPNSIRNYYYAQVAKRAGGEGRAPRFVPFEEHEVRQLLQTVLTQRAQGRSVRACLTELAGGDHRVMLRYQNKYRSVIKSRPALVSEIVESLRDSGVQAQAPETARRPRLTLPDALRDLDGAAQAQGDPELIRACEVLTRAILAPKTPDRSGLGVRVDLYRMALEDKNRVLTLLAEASQSLVDAIKGFLGLPDDARCRALPMHCAALSERIGLVEQRLAEIAWDETGGA